MLTLLLVFGISLGLCLLLTPLARLVAARIHLVDRPDGRRKLHATATPLAGGLVIFVSVVAAVACVLLTDNPFRDHLLNQGVSLAGLLAASVIICTVGVADDYGCLRGRHKLVGQALAASVAILSGTVIRSIHLFHWHFELGILALPVTLLWLLAAINSLNLLDGMDGLLGFVGLIITLAIAVVAGLKEQWTAVCIALALAGALLGFLRYNFPPASIFLGDAGSMLIGLLVGTLAIHGSLSDPAAVGLGTPMALFVVPFFDTAAAIVRRKLTGRSIYTTDRGHLHHCLLRRGLSRPRILLWVSLLCLATVCGTLTSLVLRNEAIAVLTASAVVALLVGRRLFGHAELLLLDGWLHACVASWLRRPADNGSRQVRIRLQGSIDWEHLWRQLIAYARRADLVSLRFTVNAPAIHENWHARWDRPDRSSEEAPLWRTIIPMTARRHAVGWLEVTGHGDGQPVAEQISDLVKLLATVEGAVFALTEPAPRPVAALPDQAETKRVPPIPAIV